MPNINLDDKRTSQDTANSEIDLYQEGVAPTVDDPFLSQNNLGLGYYKDSEYWQQVESFADGLFGDAAFSRIISERAIAETKHKLATEGWQYILETGEAIEFDAWDERAGADEHRPRREISQRGEQIWDKLDDQQKMEAVSDKVGSSATWTPTQWRMLMMRHEGSRSRGARTLDNLFGRVSVQQVDDDVSEALEGEI